MHFKSSGSALYKYLERFFFGKKKNLGSVGGCKPYQQALSAMTNVATFNQLFLIWA